MKTWNDYKKHIKEIDPEAAAVLSLAETEASFLSSTLIALVSTSPTMTSDGSDSSIK